MSEMLIVYAILTLWYFATDMLAGELAGVKSRPWAAAVLSAAWPLSTALALLASAVIIRRLREGGGDGG